MKKALLRTLFTALIVAMVCSFAFACETGGDSSQSTHEHVASGAWQNNESQHWKVCADDNEKVDVADHTFGAWITDTEATCTEAGKRHKECSVCGYKAEEPVAAKGHKYVYTDNGDGTHSAVCENDATHVLENIQHTLGNEYAGHDAENHWKVCADCNAKIESKHEFKLDGDSYACECGESIAVTSVDLYKDQEAKRTFALDLKVKATNVLTENQEIGAEKYTVALGETYNGKLLSVKIGYFDVEGAVLENGTLTLPADAFTAGDAGEQTIVCVVACEGAVYKLNVHVTVATRVISSVEEWNTLLRDPITLNARVKENDAGKSGVYGYYILAGDIDFNHEALRDPAFREGAKTTSFAHKANEVNGKIGFAGTFDGRGYTLKNFNTANPFGLFLIADDARTVSPVIKNLVVDGVWHDNGNGNANIFGHSMAKVNFEDITINVAKTSLTGDLVAPTDGTLKGRGFICGAYANKNVYKNITVNASGCTISSLFGWWIKPAADSVTVDKDGKITGIVDATKFITCENVVVNAREITYWGRLDGNGDTAMTPADYPMTGLTYNKDVVNEIEITNNGKSFVVDLKVADTTKTLTEQVTGATGNIEIDLGNDYGTLKSVKFNGDELTGAMVENNKLIIPVGAVPATATGERVLEVEMQAEGSVNLLSVKVLIVTKAIASAEEFVSNITNKTTTYGYFVLANDIDFKNTALALPAWVQYPAHGLAWNDNIPWGYGPGDLATAKFFCGTFDGMGYKILNFNTGNENNGGRYGLFCALRDATVKNLTFDDLIHTGEKRANIFGFFVSGSTFENITINVKQSTVLEGSDMNSQYYGFLLGSDTKANTFKDMTINAQGQEIYSLFAYQYRRASGGGVADGNYVACENVVVNAKKVYYWCKLKGETLNGVKDPALDTETYPTIHGVTLNLDKSTEA